MHGVANLIHHVIDLIILQIRFIDDQRPLHVILMKGEDVLQILIQ